MLRFACGFYLCSFLSAVCLAEHPTRMDAELLWQLGRLGSAAMSSNGGSLAYTVTRYDLAENSGTTTLYLKDLNTDTQQLLCRLAGLRGVDYCNHFLPPVADHAAGRLGSVRFRMTFRENCQRSRHGSSTI